MSRKKEIVASWPTHEYMNYSFDNPVQNKCHGMIMEWVSDVTNNERVSCANHTFRIIQNRATKDNRILEVKKSKNYLCSPFSRIYSSCDELPRLLAKLKIGKSLKMRGLMEPPGFVSLADRSFNFNCETNRTTARARKRGQSY